MPKLNNAYRYNVDAALRQLDWEEQQRQEISEREARRMMYRPTYIRVTPRRFAAAFTLFFGSLALLEWMLQIFK